MYNTPYTIYDVTRYYITSAIYQPPFILSLGPWKASQASSRALRELRSLLLVSKKTWILYKDFNKGLSMIPI